MTDHIPDWRRPTADEVNRFIGRRIRHHRILLGLSLKALAARLDVSYQQIGKYERGQDAVLPYRLLALAEALGVEPCDLLAAVPRMVNAAHGDPATRLPKFLPEEPALGQRPGGGRRFRVMP